MEKSESQEKVINLGKLLVKQLDLDQSVDTLGRWMAHYLAMKISEAENAVGKEKASLEKECFDTILQIWDHRWKLPENSKPFRNFETILEFMVKLNPKRQDLLYFEEVFAEKRKISVVKSTTGDDWLEIAKEIDQYARICIDLALHSASLELSTTEQQELLRNAPNLSKDIDIKIIKYLLHQEQDFNPVESISESKEVIMKKNEIEKLQSEIEILQNFQKIHGKLLNLLEQKLSLLLK